MTKCPSGSWILGWRFTEHVGAGWFTRWDSHTGVPTQLYGPGLSMPGSVASANAALFYARDFLEQHIDLLAPGAQPEDFQLVSNDLDRGMRSVAFFQYKDGLRVIDGQLAFRFKNDRLFVITSRAFPDVPAIKTSYAQISENNAELIAGAWIAQDFGSLVQLKNIEGPFVLPLIRTDGTLTFHQVLRTELKASDPVGRWHVYLDAETHQPIAREQTLKFASAQILFNTPEVYPGGNRINTPAAHLPISVSGSQGTTDAEGFVQWNGSSSASVTGTLEGSNVDINNLTGTDMSVTRTLQPGSSYTEDQRNSETGDAQLTTYIAGTNAKIRARSISPDLDWLDDRLPAHVNSTEDSCNAWSDGTNITFLRATGQCENTARLPDVVYHEFGHSYHNHAIVWGEGSWDGALSEGVSDYYNCTISDDPDQGRGFFKGDPNGIRHIDPDGREHRWPEDVEEVHYTGLIISGALWDLRKAFINTYGKDSGVAKADSLFYAILKYSPDIPGTYVDVLSADDDDGDITNGTPNICAISSAFDLHGLADGNVASPLKTPVRNAREVFLETSECADVLSAELIWRHRDDSNDDGSQEFSILANGLRAELPDVRGEVLEYQVDVVLADRAQIFPRNPASPWYQVFTGETQELYCTDFESQPDDWTHELTSGEASEGADDWQWGTPQGESESGDPSNAYSGTRVYGNDLGGNDYNGLYQSEKVNALLSPTISTQGFDKVHLQYRRWLTVEDSKYDAGSIYSNGELVWNNTSDFNDGKLHHTDREWRFHDVDLSDTIDSQGNVKVRFELSSDRNLEFGGWNIDDFCVVAVLPVAPQPDNGGDDEDEANPGDGDQDDEPQTGPDNNPDGEQVPDGDQDGPAAEDGAVDPADRPAGKGPSGIGLYGCQASQNPGLALTLLTLLLMIRRRRG